MSKFTAVREYFLPWGELRSQLKLLFQYAEQNDPQGLKQVLKQLVPESTIGASSPGLVPQSSFAPSRLLPPQGDSLSQTVAGI